MTAHDATGRQSAHHSPLPSVKPRFMNVDETGVSMSWKTAAVVIFAVASGILSIVAFIATLATKDDVNGHDKDPHAHIITITNPYDGKEEEKPLPEVVAELQNDMGTVKKEVKKIDEVQNQVTTVKDNLVEDQAERLADRAADRERNPSRKIEMWKRVKAKAIKNKREGKSMRDGIEELVF